MSEKEFVNGLIIRAPKKDAPEWVKAQISMKRVELIEWLRARNDEWINLDVLVSQEKGTWYASVNNWKKEDSQDTSENKVKAEEVEQNEKDEVKLEDIPF